ncbi:MAG TPA: electron transfer flavoprotein subunit alpha/FixB family protein [Candidatus Sulfotelmatobacter sp.]|nr:electron transfer flavoprotein subunit alpha/FixB family protein [Candidatus Sulfotelmatobacter sp.]
MPRIFAYIAQKNGALDDSAAELAAAAKKIDANASLVALVAGSGPQLETVCAESQKIYPEVWKISNDALSYPNAELIRKVLVKLVPSGAITLLAHDHFGIDLAPGLAIKLNAAFVPDVTGIEALEGSSLKLVRQEFGGQLSAHVKCDVSSGAVITVRPGAFKAVETLSAAGTLIDKSSEVGTLNAGRRYLETIVPEASDVDITKHAVLVSVGRGIQEKDNVAIAEELADVLGAAVSCSRPVVDAKWLQKSRQVGSSGKTVKPKVYLACGISGAFQHLAGIKGNPLIIAINKNPKAPIFQVADIGIVDDVLEFLPELTNKVQELRGVAAK